MVRMKILVACEYSGVVRDAFIACGHDAISCDILPTDSPGPHIQGDVLNVIHDEWELIIAHPPCTYLANSGVCHLHTNDSRWEMMRQGAAFFNAIAESDCEKIAIENPIPHGYARAIIGKYSQIVHPWMFGHKEQKATCLWLKGLPNLTETDNVKELMMLLPENDRQRIHYLPPSKNRSKLRSKTYTGIANAMAEQWGSINE